MRTEVKLSEFLPEKPIAGHTGFYPCANKEAWRDDLPLPMRCSTWFHEEGRARVKAVVFDVWFDNYGIKANVHVHPQEAFKALFCLNDGGTPLYSVVAVILEDGSQWPAKWWQDSNTGSFAIGKLNGGYFGCQGGFLKHLPENCYKNEAGEWRLGYCHGSKDITYSCLV